MVNLRDQFNFKKFSRSTNPRTAPAYHANAPLEKLVIVGDNHTRYHP